jgi:hypothetical protein
VNLASSARGWTSGSWASADKNVICQLRQIEFRGIVLTAMVHDVHPIIGYFRYLNDDLIAGAMDAKSIPGQIFYFNFVQGGSSK